MPRVLVATLALLLLVAATAIGRPRADVVFSGRVTSAQSARPVVGARVALAGSRRAATTSEQGRYTLSVPRGELAGAMVSIEVSAAGYERATASVRVTGEAVRRDFALRAVTVADELVEFVDIEEFKGVGAVAAEAAPSRSAAAPPPPPPPSSPAAAIAGRSALQAVAGAVSPPGGWNTEEYDRIEEGTFVATAADPLSTFSVDVDRASYSNIRRFLLDGTAPPKDAVRIEEMLNYFTYDYAEPQRGQPFSITSEVAAAPWSPRHQLVRIGLHSTRVETEDLPPSNLVFLIDVSGSMQSPDKLPLVKQSLRMLVNELRPRDRVAIVVYAGAAGLVLPSTPGGERTRILSAIERLEAGGSTAGGAGLRLAYEVAREHAVRGGNNRVILATDGDFNVGVSSDAEMVRLVEERRRQGTFLTVLGFGTGNLKDAKMEQMADAGNGNYAYIDSLLEARKVLVSEMGGTLLTVAKDVKIQVEFNPSRVQAYRLIGYENRALADHEFNDDAKDAGEIGAGHSVTALYEIVPVGVEPDVRIGGTDDLRYQAPARPAPRQGGAELAFVKVRYKAPNAETSRLMQQVILARSAPPSTDLTFASAVAGFGMLLRDSEFKGSLTPERVISLARRGLGEDEEGYRADFIRLVERYRDIERGELTSADW
jgi:Ca-activated chloride channel homolog